ncbi:hypothetical protein N7535_006378 [Penicillium sp. DV-2018c]|nr:hypothetical protein N7461_007543 [Penicillium sp. DV-2018c]KAJ5567072.1 hypothetical protein N7535_006378 [Penicillium sp. DV-2018c]
MEAGSKTYLSHALPAIIFQGSFIEHLIDGSPAPAFDKSTLTSALPDSHAFDMSALQHALPGLEAIGTAFDMSALMEVLPDLLGLRAAIP